MIKRGNWRLESRLTRRLESPRYNVAQTFLSAGAGDFPVPRSQRRPHPLPINRTLAGASDKCWTPVSLCPSVHRVPNAPKPAAPSDALKELPFEEALKKLEAIVESMESGELPLESLLARFEEGTNLVKTCQTKLEEAELKISQLEKNAAGEPVLKPSSVTENDE